MDSQLTLTYVDIRGLAEPINLILIDANIDYRDERMSLSQWNSRKLEGIYGPVYGQPFHDLPTLSVKTTIGTAVLAGIFTILEYLEDAFDVHAGKDVLYKAKINMIRDASMSFLQGFHSYLNLETWDSSEQRAHFREHQILPFLLDLSRHIGVNGVQSEFGADTRQPLTAAGACVFEALDLIELFFPAALNDWPVLALIRGRISVRPYIQKYLQGKKRQQKVSMSPFETPERVAYLSLRNIAQRPLQSETLTAPLKSTEAGSNIPGSPARPVLKKKRHPSSHSIRKGNYRRSSVTSKGDSEAEAHQQSYTSKDDDASSKYSVKSEKRSRVHSLTSLFTRKKGLRIDLQSRSNDSVMMDVPNHRNSSRPSDGDSRSTRSVQRAPSVRRTTDPPFLTLIPKTMFALPMSGGNVRSSVHSDSIYSNSSGPEYTATALAI